jgi:predicted DNA-binding protein YlxM (UPF0122 family)
MSEEEIIEFLESYNGEYFSLGEICNALQSIANDRSIRSAVSRLVKHNEIKFKRIDSKLARKIYGKNIKKGIFLYFIKD